MVFSQRCIIGIGRVVIALAARLVPEGRRKDWRMEWEAEITHASHARGSRWRHRTLGGVRLFYRCIWALRDAIVVRRLIRSSENDALKPRAAGPSVFARNVLSDARNVVRSLRRTPGFAVTVLLTMTLGIGATTSVFSVVSGVLLNPLPHADADQLVAIWETDTRFAAPATRVNVSGGNFADWRRQARSFESIAAYSIGRGTLTGLGEPEIVTRAWVTSDLLPLLRARSTLGRVFVAGEDATDSDLVVVLSYFFWQRRFGGDPEVLGRSLTLNSDSYEIVGVLDASVDLLARGIQVWTPYRIPQSSFEDRRSHFLNVLARLEPQVTHRQAQAEMDAIADRIRLEHAEWMAGRGVNVLPLRDELVGRVRPTLLVLLGAVLVVLLITAVNVASLLLVRAVGKRREMAVQSALGAGRSRLICQSLTESLTLSLTGGALGVTLAAVGTDSLIALAPVNMPRAAEVGLDHRVLAFALGISVFTGLAVGFLPALHATNVSMTKTLATVGRWSVGGERRRLRQTLVIGELALSMTLLICAGLLTQTFWRLTSIDPGFTTESVLTTKFRLPQNDYPDVARATAFYEELLNEVRILPQVRTAGLTRFLPLSDGSWTFSIDVQGLPPVPAEDRRAYAYHPTSTGYFRAAGITLLSGRDFTRADGVDALPVLIINEAMKQQFWPDIDPVGERIRFTQDAEGSPWREIVGVVKNVRHNGLQHEPRPTVYGPFQQTFFFMVDRMRLVVRTSSDPLEIAQMVRRIVHRIDPNLAVFDVRTMDQLVTNSVSQPRFSMWLTLGFAVVAAILALIGIYGVISSGVRHRLPELGLRIALGAPSRRVRRMVLSQGMALAAVGIGIGVVGALLCTRLLKNLLFGISATDPLTYVVLALFLAVASAAACYVPARRAASADPMAVMRGGE